MNDEDKKAAIQAGLDKRTDAANKESQIKPRAGLDFVSAPKSVSIEALGFGNQAALDAHLRAAQSVTAYLESDAGRVYHFACR